MIIKDIVPEWSAYKKWSKDFFVENYGNERVTLKAVQVRESMLQ